MDITDWPVAIFVSFSVTAFVMHIYFVIGDYIYMKKLKKEQEVLVNSPTRLLIDRIVSLTGGPQHAFKWLYTPNPALDNDSPINRIRSGNMDSVIKLLDELESGVCA